MNIINIEKLDDSKLIVMVGRYKHVVKVAQHLRARLYITPRYTDYFADYPLVVEELAEDVTGQNGLVIITTQDKEFLDCLLTSALDFTLATVRQWPHDGEDTYRLRVLAKEEAWENRRDFNMELRI